MQTRFIHLAAIAVLGTTLGLVAMTGQRAVHAASASVTIRNFSFSPSSLSIPVGTTVTWTNQDTVAHTSTSDAGDATSWDSGSIAPGGSFSMTFNQAGTFTYHCAIHPNMHGSVVVGQVGGGSTATPRPTSVPTSPPTSVPTVTPIPTAAATTTPVTTSTPRPSATPQATSPPASTATPSATATPTSTAIAPTATARATATATPHAPSRPPKVPHMGMGSSRPLRRPTFRGFYDGHKDTYLSTDVSTRAMAKALHTNFAPGLTHAAPASTDPMYLVAGRAAVGQVAVFGSEPGEADYSPLWYEVIVRWKAHAHPVVLTSDNQIFALQKKGKLTVTHTHVIMNCPIINVGKG